MGPSSISPSGHFIGLLECQASFVGVSSKNCRTCRSPVRMALAAQAFEMSLSFVCNGSMPAIAKSFCVLAPLYAPAIRRKLCIVLNSGPTRWIIITPSMEPSRLLCISNRHIFRYISSYITFSSSHICPAFPCSIPRIHALSYPELPGTYTARLAPPVL